MMQSVLLHMQENKEKVCILFFLKKIPQSTPPPKKKTNPHSQKKPPNTHTQKRSKKTSKRKLSICGKKSKLCSKQRAQSLESIYLSKILHQAIQYWPLWFNISYCCCLPVTILLCYGSISKKTCSRVLRKLKQYFLTDP